MFYISVTPAMQAGLIKKVMTFEDFARLAETEAPKKRGSYKKKMQQKKLLIKAALLFMNSNFFYFT